MINTRKNWKTEEMAKIQDKQKYQEELDKNIQNQRIIILYNIKIYKFF